MNQREMYWKEVDKSFWRVELEKEMLSEEGAKLLRRRKEEIMWIVFDKEFVLYTIAKILVSLGMDLYKFISFLQENEEGIKRNMFSWNEKNSIRRENISFGTRVHSIWDTKKILQRIGNKDTSEVSLNKIPFGVELYSGSWDSPELYRSKRRVGTVKATRITVPKNKNILVYKPVQR